MKSKLIIILSVLVGLLIAVIAVMYVMKTPDPVVTVVEDITVSEAAKPLYLTTMTHLEDAWSVAATDESFFDKIAAELRYGMDFAEKYDAVLTFESGLPFSQGCVNFDDNVLMEAIERGQGVGTHVDLPAKKEMSIDDAVAFISERKDVVDSLVGEENSLGCSGLGGKTDWYAVAKGAGCSYIDGTVSAHYLTMPLGNRPEGWTDEAIMNEFWHYPAPVGDDRFYPFWISGSDDFVEDADGDILLSSGETFDIAMWEETGGRNNDRVDCGADDCAFTDSDIEALVKDITEFATSRDTSKIAKYNIYIPAKLFVPENEEVLNLFFSEMQKLQDAGILEWASQKSVYEAVLAEKTS
ncbi:MAG: hypothetical protein UV80_C0009G0016 [Candidatus Peregrinibacteria bacterium GW2011_GWF2_43_17]|nr:MAG: hypothetical protein UV80_C0009G0016 [Candidatus Peregrinibacteria bacterium GW2011_GWF2_43_17]KKT20641.1 MAG: hypothetical protein UW03_C0001G0011 [Candidatus Peregrinibacteria bacterium GW2011_GWA2_43_8]HAU39330.1 hypothetical protein [Candidatus Peregrinibacteria bacterium]